MAKNTPTPAEWRSLYAAAGRIKEIAPWEWMSETDIFGVQNPETGELGFVSVMGTLGEHYALAVYLGTKGLYGFLALEEAGPLGAPEQILEVPQLQASFEDRDILQTQDRELIKQLGLKFRGRQAWPMFRSYRPGYVPWFLEAAEARFLTHVLEQAADVTVRFKTNWPLLPRDGRRYLVRVSQPAGSSLAWEDQLLPVPPPEPEPIQLRMDPQLLAALKRQPAGKHILEIDLFLLPMAVEDKGSRPYYPYSLMVVDQHSGMILGQDMLKADPSLAAMWGLVPLHTLRQLAKTGVPKEVRVRSPLLAQLLKPLAEELRFKIKQSAKLPTLDSAKDFLFQRFW